MNEYFISLEGMINDVSPDKLLPFTKQKKKITNWLSLIENQTAIFEGHTIEYLTSIHDSQEATKYLHLVQSKIDKVAMLVLKFKRTYGLPVFMTSFYESVGLVLSHFLDGLLRRFKIFFNPDLVLPISFATLLAAELKLLIAKARQSLSGTRLNKHLLSIALRPAEVRVDDPSGMSYKEFEYHRALCNGLLSLRSEPIPESYMLYDYQVISTQLKDAAMAEHRINIQVHILLLHFNFNTPDYISFCIVNLQRKLGYLPTDKARLNVLRLYLKLMNQVILRPESSLIPQAGLSASKQIAKWVEEEINFFPTQTPDNSTPIGIEKIDTDLSSSELAVFINTIKKAKIITETNNSKIYRSFAAVFNTVGSDNLTADSIRSKATNERPTALEKVKDRFWQCFTLLRDH